PRSSQEARSRRGCAMNGFMRAALRIAEVRRLPRFRARSRFRHRVKLLDGVGSRCRSGRGRRVGAEVCGGTQRGGARRSCELQARLPRFAFAVDVGKEPLERMWEFPGAVSE